MCLRFSGKFDFHTENQKSYVLQHYYYGCQFHTNLIVNQKLLFFQKVFALIDASNEHFGEVILQHDLTRITNFIW